MENGKWKMENKRIFLNFPFSVFHFPFYLTFAVSVISFDFGG
jgi:hypothetical protein